MRGAVRPSIPTHSGARIHAEKYKITTLWRRTTTAAAAAAAAERGREKERADEDAHLGCPAGGQPPVVGGASSTMISIIYWPPIQQRQSVVNPSSLLLLLSPLARPHNKCCKKMPDRRSKLKMEWICATANNGVNDERMLSVCSVSGLIALGEH